MVAKGFKKLLRRGGDSYRLTSPKTKRSFQELPEDNVEEPSVVDMASSVGKDMTPEELAVFIETLTQELNRKKGDVQSEGRDAPEPVELNSEVQTDFETVKSMESHLSKKSIKSATDAETIKSAESHLSKKSLKCTRDAETEFETVKSKESKEAGIASLPSLDPSDTMEIKKTMSAKHQQREYIDDQTFGEFYYEIVSNAISKMSESISETGKKSLYGNAADPSHNVNLFVERVQKEFELQYRGKIENKEAVAAAIEKALSAEDTSIAIEEKPDEAQKDGEDPLTEAAPADAAVIESKNDSSEEQGAVAVVEVPIVESESEEEGPELPEQKEEMVEAADDTVEESSMPSSPKMIGEEHLNDVSSLADVSSLRKIAVIERHSTYNSTMAGKTEEGTVATSANELPRRVSFDDHDDASAPVVSPIGTTRDSSTIATVDGESKVADVDMAPKESEYNLEDMVKNDNEVDGVESVTKTDDKSVCERSMSKKSDSSSTKSRISILSKRSTASKKSMSSKHSVSSKKSLLSRLSGRSKKSNKNSKKRNTESVQKIESVVVSKTEEKVVKEEEPSEVPEPQKEETFEEVEEKEPELEEIDLGSSHPSESKMDPTPLEASMSFTEGGVKSFEEAVHGIIMAPKGKVRSDNALNGKAGTENADYFNVGCDCFSFWK